MNRSAYTLIELVIVISILGILSVGGMVWMTDSVIVYKNSSDETRLAGETWITLERIARELRNATVVTTPARGATSSSLSFTRPSAAASDCAGCVDNSTDISFSYISASHKLWRTTAASSSRLLADRVTSFTVTASDDDADKRIYTITIASQSAGGRTVTMETTVYPASARNNGWMETPQ